MTIAELRKILTEAGVEFFVSKITGRVATVHLLVEDNDNAT
jgi:hypothetical protein